MPGVSLAVPPLAPDEILTGFDSRAAWAYPVDDPPPDDWPPAANIFEAATRQEQRAILRAFGIL